MARCEDCLHFEVCQALEQGNGIMRVHPLHCGCYKPTADVVEVVRCKDCRYCRNLPNGLCYAWTEPATNERGYKGEVHCVGPDDFCSIGQRMEGGE
jgi:hypothetical protein